MKSVKNIYLDRYAFSKRWIKEQPCEDLQIIVVIPCYNEKGLIASLGALYACDDPRIGVEIIVVINDAEDSSEEVKSQNRKTHAEVSSWMSSHYQSFIKTHVIYACDLPTKKAGVGLARKIGMDEAVRRLDILNRHEEGIVVGFDADCTCKANYFVAIKRHFERYKETPACSIYFEHVLCGVLPDVVYDSIVYYELFLRYYINALRFSGFMYAYQTLGSCFAVRSLAYQKQGGMNTRKAGEDFYFLHKIMPLGGFSELNETCVFPSPRVSDRVPFGTGRAVREIIEEGCNHYLVYNIQIFKDLKVLLLQIDRFFRIDKDHFKKIIGEFSVGVQDFLIKQDFVIKVDELNSNTASLEQFRLRFYRWFDGFRAMKYAHFMRDHYYKSANLMHVCHELLLLLGLKFNSEDPKELLCFFRDMDKSRSS